MATPALLDAWRGGAPEEAPGAVTVTGTGPAPVMLESIDEVPPARDLLRHRNKYFIGVLDPAASIETSARWSWPAAWA